LYCRAPDDGELRLQDGTFLPLGLSSPCLADFLRKAATLEQGFEQNWN
jgi:hypothetical protein